MTGMKTLYPLTLILSIFILTSRFCYAQQRQRGCCSLYTSVLCVRHLVRCMPWWLAYNTAGAIADKYDSKGDMRNPVRKYTRAAVTMGACGILALRKTKADLEYQEAQLLEALQRHGMDQDI